VVYFFGATCIADTLPDDTTGPETHPEKIGG